MGNRQDTVTIDRLKEALVEEDGSLVPVAQPPRRGRPPLQTPGPNAQPANPLPVAAGLTGAHQSSPSPTPSPTPPTTPAPTPSPTPPTTPSVSGRPTYAEVTTRGGRNTRLPARYRD
jgi:predicted component of type VI protein secretion system